MSSLAERMKQLRENNNTTSISDATNSTSLETFLCLYNKSGYECALDFMRGAELLHEYLSPIVIPDIPETELPKYTPALFNRYQIDRLANIFYPLCSKLEIEDRLAKISYLERVIIYLTCKEIANGH